MAKLTKHEDGWAIVFDPALLKQLGIDADTILEISTDGRRLMIAPADPQRRAKFEAAVKQSMEKYASVFKRLAG